MSVKKRTPWLEALYAAMPLCFSYIPVGLACGMLLQKAGFNIFLTALLSMLVFFRRRTIFSRLDDQRARIICVYYLNGFLLGATLRFAWFQFVAIF